MTAISVCAFFLRASDLVKNLSKHHRLLKTTTSVLSADRKSDHAQSSTHAFCGSLSERSPPQFEARRSVCVDDSVRCQCCAVVGPWTSRPLGLGYKQRLLHCQESPGLLFF